MIQLDIFKDSGIQPKPMRVWFTGEVWEQTSPHHDLTWSYKANVKYRPVPSSAALGIAGPCYSHDVGVDRIFSWCQRVLERLPRVRTEAEIMDCYAEQVSVGHIIHRKDRVIKYSLEMNGTEIIGLTTWKGYLENGISQTAEIFCIEV